MLVFESLDFKKQKRFRYSADGSGSAKKLLDLQLLSSELNEMIC